MEIDLLTSLNNKYNDQYYYNLFLNCDNYEDFFKIHKFNNIDFILKNIINDNNIDLLNLLLIHFDKNINFYNILSKYITIDIIEYLYNEHNYVYENSISWYNVDINIIYKILTYRPELAFNPYVFYIIYKDKNIDKIKDIIYNYDITDELVNDFIYGSVCKIDIDLAKYIYDNYNINDDVYKRGLYDLINNEFNTNDKLIDYMQYSSIKNNINLNYVSNLLLYKNRLEILKYYIENGWDYKLCEFDYVDIEVIQYCIENNKIDIESFVTYIDHDLFIDYGLDKSCILLIKEYHTYLNINNLAKIIKYSFSENYKDIVYYIENEYPNIYNEMDINIFNTILNVITDLDHFNRIINSNINNNIMDNIKLIRYVKHNVDDDNDNVIEINNINILKYICATYNIDNTFYINIFKDGLRHNNIELLDIAFNYINYEDINLAEYIIYYKIETYKYLLKKIPDIINLDYAICNICIQQNNIELLYFILNNNRTIKVHKLIKNNINLLSNKLILAELLCLYNNKYSLLIENGKVINYIKL